MPTEFRHPITNFINPHTLPPGHPIPFTDTTKRNYTNQRISKHIKLREILLDALYDLLRCSDDFETGGRIAVETEMHE